MPLMSMDYAGNDLVSADELSGFPGDPFADGVIEGAVAALRAAAGWHIAPSRTETLTVDSDGGNRLILPTLHLTAVTEVRDLSGDEPVVMTGYRWSKAGILSLRSGWPCGFQSVEVDITHGYDSCPPELFAVIANISQSFGIDRNVSARTVGPFSETYRDASSSASSNVSDPILAILARYTLPSRP